MEAEYTITEDDYVAAMKLFAKLTPRAALIYGTGIALLLAVAFLGTPVLRGGAIGGLIGGALVVVFGRFLLSPLLARRHYRRYKAIQSPVHITLEDEGVRFQSANGEGIVRWKKIYKWRQNDRYLLIYPMPRLYHIVPKSIQASGFDLSHLVAKLEEKVGNAC